MANAQNERFAGAHSSASDPAIGGVTFTGTADVTLDKHSRGVYISTAGNLAVVMLDGTSVTFTGLLAGVVYPFCFKSIADAGTTAAGVVLL